MRKIVYYVAASVDGFIAGPNEEIDQFLPDGLPLVEQYQKDLLDFDTVIMGKHTYEFEYAFDLKLIDVLKIKLNPFVFNKGIPLFGPSGRSPRLKLKDLQKFDSGAMIITYDIQY